jgi:hypothetical protein
MRAWSLVRLDGSLQKLVAHYGAKMPAINSRA